MLQTMSQLGVTLLLFMVGLEIRVSELFSIGKSLLIASVGQIVLTFLAGFTISLFFGIGIFARLLHCHRADFFLNHYCG
jgi:Kef-type K+ transport system membrane component KefB